MSVDFYALWGTDEKPELGEPVNVSNVNAQALLDLLGYNSGWSVGGDASPDEFLARVRRAGMRIGNVSGADDGEPWTEGRGARGARWVDCGRRPGYFAARLLELEAVAREARKHGGQVCWA